MFPSVGLLNQCHGLSECHAAFRLFLCQHPAVLAFHVIDDIQIIMIRKGPYLRRGEGVLGVKPVEHTPGDKTEAAYAYAMSWLKIFSLPFPAAHPGNLFEGLDELAACHRGHIPYPIPALLRVFKPQVQRINPQLLRGHVKLGLRGEERLRGTEPAHGAAWRFVGIHVLAQETEIRIAVHHGTKMTAQKGSCRSHRVIGPTVKTYLQVPGHKRSVLFKTHLGIYLHGMPSPCQHKVLFAGQGELYWKARFLGHKGGAELPGAQFHLASESSSDERLDHAYVVFTHAQRGGKKALHYIRRLRGC